MFRPFLRVARPGDWTGLLAELVLFGLLVLFVLIALLTRLPTSWVELVGGYPEPVRLLLLLIALYAWGWARALIIAALPGAPVLVFRRLIFRSRGRRHVLRPRDIAKIEVEGRLPDDREVFVVELRDGSRHDLCPVAWRGAGRLYARLARLVGP
ncbi:MAG: hypothetical protein IPK80_33410 [Nannocystis sp.]|nr:hypothetical protein [Nannocystis sp.]